MYQILAKMKLKHTNLTNDKRLLHIGSKLTINIERPTQLMIKNVIDTTLVHNAMTVFLLITECDICVIKIMVFIHHSLFSP